MTPKRKGGKQKNKSAKRAKGETVNAVKEDKKMTTDNAPKKQIAFNMVKDAGDSSAKIEEAEEEVEVALEWVDEENITLGDHSVYNYAGMNPDV